MDCRATKKIISTLNGKLDQLEEMGYELKVCDEGFMVAHGEAKGSYWSREEVVKMMEAWNKNIMKRLHLGIAICTDTRRLKYVA